MVNKNPNQVYKRDNKGQFAKVNTLLKKIAMAKAQGVKHVEPGPSKKVPPAFSLLKNQAAKKLGHDIYMRKKAGEFSNDHALFLACVKLAADYKKKHPTASAGMSGNQIHNAYKRHEYDETGQVMLLGEIKGKLDRTGPGADAKPSAPSKPTIDTTKSGLNIASDKFPKPDNLTYTGKTLGGVTGAKVYEDSKGQKWVVKAPKTGSNAYGNKSFMVDIEIAASRIQNKAGLQVPAMHPEDVDGKHAAVSKMYTGPNGGPVKDAFPKGAGLDISTMSPEDLLALQRNQVLDWLISNHDSHSGNFLRTDTGIVGIDKGQSFKFFGKDKLDYNYQPVMPLDGNVSVYQSIWKQFAQGYGELFNPNGDELKGTIERIQNIPDAEYRKLLRPYAEKAAASGTLSMPNKPAGATQTELIQHFLDAAVERKNNLAKDFDAYYKKVKAEHDKNKPQPKVAPSTGKVKAGAGVPASGSGVGKNKVSDLSPVEQYNKGILSTEELKNMSSPVGFYKDLKVGDKLLKLYDDGSLDDIIELTEVTPNPKAANQSGKGAKYKSLMGNYSGEFYPNYFNNGSDSKNTYIIPESVPEAKASNSGGAAIYTLDELEPYDTITGANGEKFNVVGVEHASKPNGYITVTSLTKNSSVQWKVYQQDLSNYTLDTGGPSPSVSPRDAKPVGTQLWSTDIKPGMWMAMKVGESGKLGPAFHVDKIENGNVYASKPDGNGAQIDMPLSFFASGNFFAAASPLDDTSGPELNKPLKGIDGLKIGDKVEAPWGATFTVTEVHLEASDPYVATSNADGGFGGNLYGSTIKLAHGGGVSPWTYTGNIHDQGSVDANDLAGQPVQSMGDLIPGDKIVVTTGIKNQSEMEVVVTNVNDAPNSIYAKKTATGGVVKLLKSDFANGKVKFALADNASETGDFKPLAGKITELDIFAGDEVSISDGTSTDTGKVHFVSTKHGGQIDVEVGGSNQPIEFVPVMKNGVVSWVDDPQSFLDGDPVSVLGKTSDKSTAPTTSKAVAGQAADFNDVVVGDVVSFKTNSGNTLTAKITKLNDPPGVQHKAEVIDPGGTGFVPGNEVMFSAVNHFEQGKVKWASQAAAKKKIKIKGEQANIEGVEVGDVLDVFHSLGNGGGVTTQWKVLKTSPTHTGVDVINMKDGSTQVITPADFISGDVFWGDQKATSISAQQWPTYPAKDIQAGPFTNKNAPGTTLKNLKLPGWGGYIGQLEVGDDIVAMGTNGDLKKGSVVQKAWGPNNCYISWDDDPSGDWVELTKSSTNGLWGDGSMNSTDEWTLVGKIESANAAAPPPQMPSGPLPAPAAAVTPTAPTLNPGKPATFDSLDIGSVYHVPGGKMQKVISKTATEFTAQSVSGNTHTYPKEKFDAWAASKGAVLGMPGENNLAAPAFSSVNKGDVFVVPADPFNPNGTTEKYVIVDVAGGKIKYKPVGQQGAAYSAVSQKDWESTAAGWKFVPGQSDWEKYANGIITWEEYQQTNGHQEVAKLHKPEGPAAPGKPSPAAQFTASKSAKIVEKKPPPPWAGIKGDDAVLKDLGQQIYDMKKQGKFESDKALYLACGRLFTKWKKANPNHADPPPSANAVRQAARRVEFEETGAVVWETEQQMTAQVVGNVQTAKSAINHVPTGKYAHAHSLGKMPLTAFGDSNKLAGSYQNPVNYGTSSYVTPEMALFGAASNPQTGYTQGERKSIADYTGSGYTGINSYLRTGGVNYGSATGYQTAVKNIDSAIAKSNPIEDWTIVTRGAHGGYDIGIDHDNNVGLDEIRAQIGKTVENKGYSSTSLGSTPAFSHRKYRIIYRVPPGLKGIWVSGDGSSSKLSSCGSSEREFILPRNLKLKVLAANENTDGNAKFDVIVEIVGWEGQGK